MRVLVVPASRHGGTAEIGRAIASTLRSRGIDVDVSQPEHMFDLSPYSAHIVGSALYLGNWLQQATTFVEEHGEALRGKPTWLFSSGPLGPNAPEEPIGADRVDHLVAISGAKGHRTFGGRLDISRLSRTERFIANWVGARDADMRDWNTIETWAADIAEQLIASTGQPTEPVPGGVVG